MGRSGVNWNNVPHESILGQINGGAGVAPVNEAAVGYARIAGTLREADADLRNALAGAGASWEGVAAADMTTAATPLATWADEADRLARDRSDATDTFGGQFANTRTAMPPAVNVPSGSWVDDLGLSSLPGVTTDRERAEEAADAAQQEAARRMEVYDNASYETVRTQYFSQPPAVVLEVPPPSTTGGPGVGGTTTSTGSPVNSTSAPPAGVWTPPPSSVPRSPQVGTGSPTGPSGAVIPAPTTPSYTPGPAVVGGPGHPVPT
ncbi:MAG TPA: PPE domain-containing protein, partial [Pseudonocardiaceae bacterium]